MEDKRVAPRPIKAHSLHLENRSRVVVTGVEDVDNFNEEEINFQTECGYVTLTGADLHINRFSMEEGQLVIEGTINGVAYSASEEANEHSSGFFSKLFK